MATYVYAFEPWRAISSLLMGTTWNAPANAAEPILPPARGPEFVSGPLPETFDDFHRWLTRTRGTYSASGTRYFDRARALDWWQSATTPRYWVFGYQRRGQPLQVVLSRPFHATLLDANRKLLAEQATWAPWWRTVLMLGGTSTFAHPDPKLRARGHLARQYTPIVPLRALTDGLDPTRTDPVSAAERAAFYRPSDLAV